MTTIEDFILHNVGRPNVTPKGLIREAYAMGLAHGKGEEYESVPEEEEVEEPMQEEEPEEEEDVEDDEEEEEDEEGLSRDGDD